MAATASPPNSAPTFGFWSLKEINHVCYFVLCDLKHLLKCPICPSFTRFDIRHYLGRPFPLFLYSYHLWYMSTCYMCLSSHRKSVYGTRTAMPRKTRRLRLSQKIMKFYVLTRFRETNPTVQSVSSSKA